MADTGAKHPIVIEGSDSAKTFGIKGFPTMYVVDADGKVAAQGMPNEQMLEQLLQKVRLVPKLPAKLAPMQKLLDARKFAEARAGLSKVAETSVVEEEKSSAQAAVAWIDENATRRMASAAEDLGKGNIADAAQIYRDLSEQYKGTDAGTSAANALKELLADPAKKKELDAADGLAKLKAKIADMKAKKALPFVKGFVNSNKGTKAGDAAQKVLEGLEKELD